MYASSNAVTRFVAPGPDVAQQTPTRPDERAYPPAAKAAAASCRHSTWRTACWNSASYSGMIVPPG